MRWAKGVFLIALLAGIGACSPVRPKSPTAVSPPVTAMAKSPGPSTRRSSAAPQKPPSQSTPVRNVVLARTRVPGYSDRRLELVDVTGQYTYDSFPGPFQGDNWTGRFQLRLLGPTGRVLSRYDLSNLYYRVVSQSGKLLSKEDWFTRFGRRFQFSFSDYNGDGYPDFALGQYFGNDHYRYQLFTIKPSGIEQLPVKPPGILAADEGYSAWFPKVGFAAFQVTYYDNASGNRWTVIYAWGNGTFTVIGKTPFSPTSPPNLGHPVIFPEPAAGATVYIHIPSRGLGHLWLFLLRITGEQPAMQVEKIADYGRLDQSPIVTIPANLPDGHYQLGVFATGNMAVNSGIMAFDFEVPAAKEATN